MREFHARCVKFSRVWPRCRKLFCGFAEILAKNPVGIVRAKDIPEIQLTAGVIQVGLPNCPRTKTKN
jgi:hypothetical protein